MRLNGFILGLVAKGAGLALLALSIGFCAGVLLTVTPP